MKLLGINIGEVILVEEHKKRIKKEDGRYLIYYTFTDTEEEEEEGKDVRAEMESHPETMDNNSNSSTE
ncbi:hypothetical protein CVT91_07180 [Candidatus Atribacteria bacterium HGW-Atribacteria-1]|nr:MAG: hypothetical protein CVT91_07180 [Candidatus Atribacteria bacterium HGW-Atribacteria-1]